MTKCAARLSALFCLMLLASGAIARQTSPAYTPHIKGGWEILFDGKSLDAWDTERDPGAWVVDNQKLLYVARRGSYLYTKRRYCDFVIELDFRVTTGRKSNSGVFLHVHDKNDPVNTGMEIQILDDADHGVSWDSVNATGALYDLVHPSVDARKAPGEWNHYRITMDGSWVTVVLNGKQIVKADISRWTVAGKNPDGAHNKFHYAIAALPREGFIALQNHGGSPVWFRNIRVRELSHRQPQYTGAEPTVDVLARSPAQ